MAYRVSFAAVLDALRDDEASADAFGPDIAFADPLANAPPFLWDREPAAILARARDYVGHAPDEETPSAAPVVLPSDNVEAIERELRLATITTRTGLLRARREFMWANDPDRRPDWPSELATRRVALANMLIDRALRQRRKAW